MELRRASQSIKDDALKYGAEYILKNVNKLVEANEIDMELASKRYTDANIIICKHPHHLEKEVA